jgi:transcriptional regulator with XRE-family HTH domain
MLRARRTVLGLTVEDAAKHLLVSPSKISRVETGQRNITTRDIRDLAILYRLTDAERELLAELAVGGKTRAWWQPFNLPYSYATYVGLEADATSIRDFTLSVVPGLLQTERYANAIAGAVYPNGSDENRQQVVQARLERQRHVLHEANTNFTAMLDESALRRVVGGPAVMEEQMKSLLAASALPNITLRVVPFAAGPLPAATNKFIILSFSGLPDVVFLESLTGQLVLERQSDIAAYHEAYAALERLALPAGDSYDKILSLQCKYSDMTAVNLWVSCCWCSPVARRAVQCLSNRDGYPTMSPSAQGLSVWRKSSKCATSECVEIAREQNTILLRDSKSPETPAFRYTMEEFRAFLEGVKAGEFDDLI